MVFSHAEHIDLETSNIIPGILGKISPFHCYRYPNFGTKRPFLHHPTILSVRIKIVEWLRK